jgi:hypothetical protein
VLAVAVLPLRAFSALESASIGINSDGNPTSHGQHEASAAAATDSRPKLSECGVDSVILGLESKPGSWGGPAREIEVSSCNGSLLASPELLLGPVAVLGPKHKSFRSESASRSQSIRRASLVLEQTYLEKFSKL